MKVDADTVVAATRERNVNRPVVAHFFLAFVLVQTLTPGVVWAEDRDLETRKVVEELTESEKQEVIEELFNAGDEYVRHMEYDRANAAYEGVFLFDAEHIEASKRIDGLKKKMLSEGKEERKKMSAVYDAEIEVRVRLYWIKVEKYIAEGRLSRAKFTLEKILLIDPLDQRAKALYDQLTGDGPAKKE